MRTTKRDAAPSLHRRPAFVPQNFDDQLRATLAPALYARLAGEMQRRNAGLLKVVRALSTQPK